MSYAILFVCTGNYYRSRFAEMLFNALASRLGLSWNANSRGIATEFGVGNVGPVSPYVLKRLQALNILTEGELRAPLQLEETDLAKADRIIALNATEHLPMIEQRFAEWADQILYWHVPDLNLMGSEEAFSMIESNVGALIRELQAAETSSNSN